MTTTPPGDFDPFASAPASPDLTTTDDDINFDQFVSTLEQGGFNYPVNQPGAAAPGTPPVVDDNAPDLSQVPEGGNNVPPVPDPQATPPATVTPPPSVGETVRIGDKDVPVEEARLLYELGEAIRERGLAPAPVATPTTPPPAAPVAETPPAPVVETPPAPPSIPDFIDQDDPVQMGLYKMLEETRAEVASTRQQTQAQIEEAGRLRVSQEVDAGIAEFKRQYPSITDEEIAVIRPMAAPTVSGFIKTTGGAVPGIVKSLWVAALDMPTTRDKVTGQPVKDGQAASRSRKQAQSSLAPGSNGSAPRGSSPRSTPQSDREARQQFGEALAESFGTNGRL